MPTRARTTDLLLERYSTYTRRRTATEAGLLRTAFKSFSRTIVPWLPRDVQARLLDVGCGDGALLLFLVERGYSCLDGFDISPENVSMCGSVGLSFVSQFDALEVASYKPGHAYDVVLALDLLEHLPKQAAATFLRDARGRLGRGGSLIVQTPNMGCVLGNFHRFNDISHEFGLTEKSAMDLMLLAGFAHAEVEIRPAWNAVTWVGRLREQYLKVLHRLVFLSEDSSRPKIATKNLLIRGTKQ